MTPLRSATIAVVLATMLPISLIAKSQGEPKSERLTASNGRFSYSIPKTLKAATVKNSIASWTNPKDRTSLGIFPVSASRKAKLGSPFKAARSSREKAAKKEGDWFVSKVYKKVLENELPFFFYSAHQHGKIMKVSGYFVLGGDYYFVSGWTSRKKSGLPNVYAALSTIQPISGPRRKRAMKNHDSEGLLDRHRKKKKDPDVRLGEGSSTPKMLGGPKSLGSPKKTGGPIN